jgi:putative ribosome biogenesis GTPase RsgA
MLITSAQFIKGITQPDKVLENSFPQVVFMGRSNVGKSSVINSLTRQKKLAQIENKIAPELNDIEKNVIIGRKITNSELYALALLMSMLYVRSLYEKTSAEIKGRCG